MTRCLETYLRNKGVVLTSDVLAALEEFSADHCCLVWNVADVRLAARNRWRVVSDEEARVVLAKVEKAHDCSIGVSWELLECYCAEAGRPMTEAEADEADEEDGE